MTLFRKNDVLFPEKEFYSSDPLPGDWIGLITDKTVLETSEISSNEKRDNIDESSMDLKNLIKDFEKNE